MKAESKVFKQSLLCATGFSIIAAIALFISDELCDSLYKYTSVPYFFCHLVSNANIIIRWIVRQTKIRECFKRNSCYILANGLTNIQVVKSNNDKIDSRTSVQSEHRGRERAKFKSKRALTHVQAYIYTDSERCYIDARGACSRLHEPARTLSLSLSRHIGLHVKPLHRSIAVYARMHLSL